MPIYNIRGYDVDFPHEAYPCQITYMEQVLGALEQGENALLESPTGTGKTLCLLCATLAWREAFVKKGKDAAKEGSSALTLYDYQQQQAGIGAPADPAAAQHKGPSIIYSSRTHSQLAQVIKELRNTSYRVRTTVLGSRTQLCLHDKVSKLAGQAANFTCRALVAHKQCRWHTKHRQERVMKELSSAVPAPVDIEELVKIGRHAEVCPYFLSRDMANTAEVIFMPYNYLVDSQSRSQLSGINWTNAVIIVDEAHNIQDACNSNASFDLSGDQLLAAIQEMESAAGVVKENISSGRAQEGLTVYHEGGQLMPSSDAGQQAELLDRLGLGVKLLSALYQRVCELDPAAGPAAAAAAGGSSSGSALGDGVAHKGEALLAMLEELQITPESYSRHLQPLLMDAAGVLSDHELASGRAMAARSGVVAGGLSALLAALDIVFASALPLWIDPVRRVNGPPAHRGYRMFVHKPENKQGGGKKGRGTLVMGGSPTLSYWCFIPGVSMVSLRQLPLRSVLLTSGTLSPLESFAHELQLGFKYTLENPHVINNDQVWVGVIGSGPTGVTLNSSFANRNSDRYKDELGHAIVNFARVVPDGLLVFFPAYGVMQSCLDHWKASSGPGGGPSIWERILRHKAPVVEPRDSGSFGAAIADYQAKLDDPAGGGAVLFAVCRGKVSEGIDFSDKAGRGVVITGLPFPAAHDPHVKLQQQLLDEEARAGAAGISGGRGLSGQQWYVQQGLRAVNQAMGRVIRHRWDYGAVLLADERFGSAQNKRHLSRWLREQVTSHSSFGGAIGSLTKFFKDKGNIAASAAAARAAGPAAAASNAACPSAFQLIGGAEGQPGQGSRAAARSAAAEQQQRRQQLMAVPRAVDVLGLIGREEGGSSGAAAAAAAGPGSQLDSLIADMRPAEEAARSKLQQQQQLVAGRAAGSGRILPSSSSTGGRIPRSSIALSFEAERAGARQSGSGLGLSRAAAPAAAAAVAAAENEIIGPAHLVQKHKQRQLAAAGDGTADAAADAQQQQQQQQQGKGKPPLRMGQFLKQWNSTQIEQQKQQAQELEQQQQQQQVEKQQQQKHSAEHQKQQVPDAKQQQQQDQQPRDQQQQQQQQQQEVAAAEPAPALHPKSFFKLLHEQLQPQQMAAVKALLTAYKASRDLSAFVDGLIAELGASSSSGSSSSSHLLAGFAAFMPSKDREWFSRLVAALPQQQPAAAATVRQPDGAAAAAAAAARQVKQSSSSVQQQAQAGKPRQNQAGLAGEKRRSSSSSGAHQPAAAAAAAGGSSAAQAGSKRLKVQQQPVGSAVGAGKTAGNAAAGAGSKQQQKLAVQKAQGGGVPGASSSKGSGQAAYGSGLAAIAAAATAAVEAKAPAAATAAGRPQQQQPQPGLRLSKQQQQQQPGPSLVGKQPLGKLSCKPCCMCKKAPMAAAHKAGCGHLGCYSCWVQLLSKNLRGVGCPVCSKLVRRQQLAQVPFA